MEVTRNHFDLGFYIPHGASPTPGLLSALVPRVQGFGLMPTTVQVIRLGAAPRGIAVSQLRLVSEDGLWAVEFEPHRLLIRMQAGPEGKIGGCDDFASRSAEIIKTLRQLFHYDASRMSFSTRAIYHALSDVDLASLHSRLFTFPSPFRGPQVLEWSTRQVIREDHSFGGTSELLNVIVDVSRMQALLPQDTGGAPFEAIEVAFDINTFQGNQKQRFTDAAVAPFTQKAMEIAKRIEETLRVYIGPR